MKKLLIAITLGAFFLACDPSNTQEAEMKDLAAKWKNTSREATSLADKLGNNLDKWQAGFIEDTTNSTERLACAEVGSKYKSMQEEVSGFLASSQKKSLEVDELTNKLAVGSWTADEQEKMDALKVEADNRDAQIKKWDSSVDSLYQLCQDSVTVKSGK